MSNDSFYNEFTSKKPESFSEEVFITPPRKSPLKLIVILLLITPFLLGFFLFSRVTVPDFEGWSIAQVMSWSKKNGPTIITSQAYNTEIDQDYVIEQKISPGEKLSKKDSVEVVFSKGSDPDEAIEFLDVKQMSLEEIQTWIKDHDLSGVNIQYDHSDTIDKNKVINYSFIDGDSSNYKRKNRVKIYISKGSKELSETLTMPDLYGKTKDEVKKWAIDNNISLEIEAVFNDYVIKGGTIKQSIPKESKFNRSDSITVQVSKGKPVFVPNFVGLSLSEAANLASIKGVRIFSKSVHSNNPPDEVIYQDLLMDTEVEENAVITLHVSKESNMRVVPNFLGYSKEDATALASLSQIKVFTKSVDSTEKLGTVLSQSHSPQTSASDDTVIILEVSNGQQIVPDFVGLKKEEAEAMIQASGLKVIYRDSIATHVKKGVIFKQSIKAGEVCNSETVVIIEIAENTGVKIMDLTKQSKEEAESWASSKNIKLTIRDVYSNRYEKGTLFDQNYKNMYLPETEPVIIYHAKGDILVESFVGKSKLEVMQWVDQVNGQGGQLTVEYKSTSSSKYSKGQVTNQTKINEYVKLDEKITFYVCSLESAASKSVPSFTSVSEADFINWCNNNQMSYSITAAYSNTVAENNVFDQSHVNSVNPSIILRIKKSLGNVTLPDFTNLTQSDVGLWLTDVNSKSGNITVDYIAEASAVVDKDKIISQDIVPGKIAVGSKVIIKISAGN